LVAFALLAFAPSSSAQTQAFSISTPTTLTAASEASNYPLELDVTGMGGTISDVNLTLNGVTLTSPALDVLLVAPDGKASLITSDVASVGVIGQDWTFDDAAMNEQPANAPTGTYKPTDSDGGSDTGDTLPLPATPEYDQSLANFNGISPNGLWHLYIADSNAVLPVTIGSIEGWALQITTVTGITSPTPTSGDFGAVTVGQTSAPKTFTIANTGDAPMQFTQVDPDGVEGVNFVVTGTTCLGHSIDPGATCTADVAFKPLSAGTKTAGLFLDDNTGALDKIIGLSGTGLDPVLVPGPIPNQQQQPPPGPKPSGSTETGSNQVGIESVRFDGPTAVGQPTVLHVEASDDKEPVTGLLVDFGEALGLYGASACVEGAKPGDTTFDVPYRFLTPGPHTIKITILSGGCGKAESRTITFTQVVEVAKAARRAHVADTIAGPDITSKCKNASMLPSKRQAKKILKALLCVMNEQRKLAKLKPLKLSKKLGKAAAAHTNAMISGKFFAHQGPKEKALAARLKKAKYRGAAGENIGAGAGPLASPVQMVNGWMHSTLHRANLLSRKWKTVGIGFVAGFPLSPTQPSATFTTDFGVRP
jgi:uncharacterized protein YkwD